MKKCKSCNIVKDDNDFYHWQARCKECVSIADKIKAKCIDCGIERMVSKTCVRVSNGRCRSCAQKIEKNKPEVRKKSSQNARAQVIRQGGIPNAHQFTSDTAEENHWNWQGGKTDVIERLRGKKQYHDWRNAVYAKDDFTCQVCKKKSAKLHAHHIKPFRKFPELRFDINNGQTLCPSCHHRHEFQFIPNFRKEKKVH